MVLYILVVNNLKYNGKESFDCNSKINVIWESK